MALKLGARIGPYEVTASLGTGGMGEVYRATDTKLKRPVALKILPSHLASDPRRLARLRREAEVLASLNHPNIAGIYGLEENDQTTALVMELVEGSTLEDRLAGGALSVADAITIARQLAAALEAAHEQEIIHRDLKPANVKLRRDGTVKILDFGLAKFTGAPAAPALEAASAIVPSAVTADRSATDDGGPDVVTVTMPREIVGTAAYMSPEQARGDLVDERTDIWAFGCLCYEMLTGRRAFGGKDFTETIAAVVRDEPAWDALPRDLPLGLRAFLIRCLAKDPKQRIRDVHDLRLALEGAFDTGSTHVASTTPVRPIHRRPVLFAIATLIVTLGAGLAFWGPTRQTPATPVVSRFTIPLPEGLFSRRTSSQVIALSPSGTHVVFGSGAALWLRPLGALEATVIPGTEQSEGHTPFFSPDGQWIGFYAGRQIKKVPVHGGRPVVIGTTDVPFGITWGADDRILYGQGPDGIWQIDAAGGTPEQVIAVHPGEQAHGPQRLPDGALLFTLLPRGMSTWYDAQIVVQRPGTSERTVVIDRAHDARYLPTSHLVYGSNPSPGEVTRLTLMAVPFDARVRRMTGTPVLIVERAAGVWHEYAGALHYAVSASGTLMYVPALQVPEDRLVWMNRHGHEEPLSLPVRAYGGVRVAPDGRRIVEAPAVAGSISVSEIARPSWTLITRGPDRYAFPRWTPDSQRVVVQSNRDGVPSLFWTLADGTGPVEQLVTIAEKRIQIVSPASWTPDGRTLIFTYGTSPEPRLGLLIRPEDDRGEWTWRPLTERVINASASDLSLDGRWITYQSDISGQYEVYIERFPQLGDRQKVSPDGGFHPVWSPDGRELYYRRHRDGAMMAVPVVETTPALRFGTPQMLFPSWDGRVGPPAGGGGGRDWDLAPDGRFLLVKPVATTNVAAEQIVVVEHWFEELKRVAPVR